MKKLLWVMICCIMTISLVIASCDTSEGEKETTTEKEGPAEVVIEEKEVKTELGTEEKI